VAELTGNRPNSRVAFTVQFMFGLVQTLDPLSRSAGTKFDEYCTQPVHYVFLLVGVHIFSEISKKLSDGDCFCSRRIRRDAAGYRFHGLKGCGVYLGWGLQQHLGKGDSWVLAEMVPEHREKLNS